MNMRMLGLGAATVLTLAGGASAGTYANITIDGDFSDWIGVPVLFTDASGDANPIDIGTIQLANDDNNLYIRLTFPTAVNPNSGNGTFLAIDTDNNLATGFDVYGAGLDGSEAGWQNDFPFEQDNGVFNTGGGLTGAGASISPYNTTTSSQEYAISRSATFTVGGAPVFGSSFTLLAYADTFGGETVSDVAGPVSYSFAPVPEPVGLTALAMAGAAMRRRRKA